MEGLLEDWWKATEKMIGRWKGRNWKGCWVEDRNAAGNVAFCGWKTGWNGLKLGERICWMGAWLWFMWWVEVW